MGIKKNINGATIDVGLDIKSEGVEAKLKEIVGSLDIIQQSAQLDLKFKNIKGISEFINNLAKLDEKLEDVKASSNAAGKELGKSMSDAASKAVGELSTMSARTGEFAKELNSIANEKDTSKVQGRIKKLAKDMNILLQVINPDSVIDVDEIINTDDSKKQIDILSKGLENLTSGWTSFGKAGLHASDELKRGISGSSGEADELANKLLKVKNLLDEINKTDFKSRRRRIDKDDFDKAKPVRGNESANDIVSNSINDYNMSVGILKDSAASIEKKAEAYIRLTNAVHDLGWAIESSPDGNLESIFGQDIATKIEGMLDDYRANYSNLIETIKKDLQAELGVKLDVNPIADPDAGEKIRHAVEESTPDKVEVPVEVDPVINVKPKLKELEDLLAKQSEAKGQKEKSAIREEIVKTVAILQEAGMKFEDIKKEMSTPAQKRSFTSKLQEEVNSLIESGRELPSIIVELEKLRAEVSVKDTASDYERLQGILKGFNLKSLKSDWKAVTEEVKQGTLDWEQGLKKIVQAELALSKATSGVDAEESKKDKAEIQKLRVALIRINNKAVQEEEEKKALQEELDKLRKQQTPTSGSAPEKLEDDYKDVLEILNEISAKQKEIQNKPSQPFETGLFVQDAIDGDFEKDYSQQLKDLIKDYLEAKRNLSEFTKSGAPQNTLDTFKGNIKNLKEEIASIVFYIEKSGKTLSDVIGKRNANTINAESNGIRDLVTQLENYATACNDVEQKNKPLEDSIENLKGKILDIAKAANLSKDAFNTIVSMLVWSDETTDFDKWSNTISDLISGKIVPEITTLKQELASKFPDQNIDELERRYIDLFDNVQKGTITAAQALEKIEKQEKEIADAAREREEAQRKANEAPKSSGTGAGGTGTGSGSGSGTGTGSGSGTTPPSGAITTPSVEAGIKDLERLEGKVREVENTIRTTKTQAFTDEEKEVKRVIDAEIVTLGELETKLKQVENTIRATKTKAFEDELTTVSGVVDGEVGKLGELEQAICGVGSKINSLGDMSDSNSVSTYDKILEKMKQIVAERKKFVDVKDDDRLDDVLDYKNLIHKKDQHLKPEAAEHQLREIIEAIKYISTLDLSVSLPKHLYDEDHSFKDRKLVDIEHLAKGSDSTFINNWDELISSLQARCLNLLEVINSNDGALERFLSVDDKNILLSFGIDKLTEELEEYIATQQQMNKSNKDVRSSIEAITRDILSMARALDISEKDFSSLEYYLHELTNPFHEMASPNEEANYVMSRIDRNWTERNDNASHETESIESKLSSTLDNLNNAISKMIGSNDPASQNTDPNGGLSGIAQNVKAILDHLHTSINEKKPLEQNTPQEQTDANGDEKLLQSAFESINETIGKLNSWLESHTSKEDDDQSSRFATEIITPLSDAILELKNALIVEDGEQKPAEQPEDSRLTSVLADLSAAINGMVGSTDPASQNTDANKGLSGIADNVAGIYQILNGKKDSDDTKLSESIKGLVDELRKPSESDSELAGAIKSAVEELSNASRAIADDAKLRKESNAKYKSASDRISTEAGRSTIVDNINHALEDKNYFVSNAESAKFSSRAGGVVEVKATLQDLNNKFYDCAATVDEQGNVIVSSIKENIDETRKYTEQEAAKKEAAKKNRKSAWQTQQEREKKEREAKLNANRTISPEVIDGTVKSTTKAFNDYSAKNIGNMPKYLAEDYTALLEIVKQVRSENRKLDEEELRAIESMCIGLQNEIALLEVVNKNYDEQVQSLRESVGLDGASLLGGNDSQEAKKLIDEIDEKVKQLHKKLNVSDVSLIDQEEIKADMKEIENLTTRTEKFIEAAKKAKAIGGLDTKKANQFNSIDSTYKQSIADSAGLDLGEDGVAALNRYKQAYDNLLEKKQYFQNISKNDVTEADIQEWDKLTKELAECRKEYEAFAKEYSKGKVVSISAEDAKDVSRLRESMLKLASDGEKGQEVTRKFSKGYKQLTTTFRDANNELKEVIVTYNATTGTLTKSIGTVNKTKSAWESFTDKVGNKVKEMGAYFATFGSFYEVIAVIRQGITYVREIDSALTELKKVTDETDAAYNKFLQDMSKTAGIIGSTVKDLTTMAAEWSRLGYSMAESAKLAESTAILLNVSEFSDATEASEALISTMQAFQYTADESTHVVDILNEVGKLVAPR